MTSIFVELSREGRQWRIKVGVDGEIKARDVFGCTDAMNPLVFGLERCELEADRISARSKVEVRTFPSAITVRMPSGRSLTFTLTRLQQAETVEP